MITPDAPERQYSTRLRTALVLAGSGTAGAYHAGVLRALHEAGVKVDIVAGRGVGVVGAFFSAVDGGTRLWDADGLWRSPRASTFYNWRAPLRLAAWSLGAASVVFAVPLALLALAVVVGMIGLLLSLVGLTAAASLLTGTYSRWIETLFAPSSLPTIIPRLVLLAILLGVAALAGGAARPVLSARARRRTTRGLVARLLGVPLSASAIVDGVTAELWNLIRGAAALARPAPAELAAKYVELLGENLGQPGFRELLLTVHDLDAHRDLVFALLAPAYRQRFFGRAGAPEAAGRYVEAFDLAGVARTHAIDGLCAALAVPIATDPHLITFAAEGPWRGETHRLCDRPGAVARLLEEAAAAGAEQVILASAAAPPARAHEMSAGRADLRGRAGEQLASFETASLRDIGEHFAGRFAGMFVVHPAHNPVGPLDFAGVYDERSDRINSLAELIDRGYEDAYRQFIEPVVGGGDKEESA